MLNEWSVIQFQVRKQCPQPDFGLLKELRVARKSIRNVGHAWATQYGAPYKSTIDRYLGLMLSGR